MDAMAFLEKAAKAKRQSIYALIGDEVFLKRRVREAILNSVLEEADPAFAVSVYAGDRLDFSTVRNDLDTPSFLAPCRVVVVENADTRLIPGQGETFLAAHRASLEKYAAQPSSVGVLILDVKSFPETTKLAKALPDAAKITCKAPYENTLPKWCVGWAKAAYGKKLNYEAAELLVALVGPAMGLLDMEMNKLATAVGSAGIEAADVDRLVGRSSSADVFRILDAIGEGKPKAALEILEQLFSEGEDPMAVIGPMTAQLRKLATVGRGLNEKQSIGQAMDNAGIPRWEKARIGCEKQVRWLGLRRLSQLTDWLVEINLGLKGGSALPERVQVERLIVKLARPREEQPNKN